MRGDLAEDRAIADHVVAGHPDVVGGSIPADLDREGRGRRGDQVGGHARGRAVARWAETARSEGGVVEDHVPAAGGGGVADLDDADFFFKQKTAYEITR